MTSAACRTWQRRQMDRQQPELPFSSVERYDSVVRLKEDVKVIETSE